MKRQADKGHADLPIHIYLLDVEQGLSKDQLAGIGKVAVLWADCDELMNLALFRGLRLPTNMWRAVVSSLAPNKKMGLVNACAKDLLLGEEFCKVIANTVSAVGEVGSLRDDIVHASIDTLSGDPGSIGKNISRSGTRFEILRTKESLDAVAKRLSILREEITLLVEIFSAVPYSFKQQAGSHAESKAEAGQLIAPLIAKLASHQESRRGLPPLPKFPA
jgi:hypothetical protein